MVQLFGTVERTSTAKDGSQETIFRIPAISRGLAKQRAKFNARAKGLRNFSAQDATKIQDGPFPGQTIYEVKVVSE